MSSAGVGCLYGVGVGPGDPELLTLKAVRVLKAAPIVFTPQATGSKDSLALMVARNYVDESRQRLIYASFVMGGTSDGVWSEAAERIAGYLLGGEDVAFLTQGDPLLYGSFMYVMVKVQAAYPTIPIEVVPGVTSITAAASRAKMPLVSHGERLAVLPAMYGIDDLRDVPGAQRHGGADEGESQGDGCGVATGGGRRTESLRVRAAGDHSTRADCVQLARDCARGYRLLLHADIEWQEGTGLTLRNVPEGKVYFIGGGPGDPELLTLKAKRIIDSADVIIYADSLVHPSVCDGAKAGAQVIGSKTLNLDEITELMVGAATDGKLVARVQSGDPSIYGAVLGADAVAGSGGSGV